MQFSDQALGAVMMALQKSLLDQTDIVPVLKDFNFKQNEEGELFVMNPPLVRMPEDDDGYEPVIKNEMDP